jgi:hypothetical protein
LNRRPRDVAYFVVVVVVLLLVELVTPEVPAGAPIELVEPVVPAVLDVSLPAAGGVGVVVTLFSVVVLDVLDVVGVVVASRLVQAPRETAATSAKAAHEVRDAFIRNSLRGCRGIRRARSSALLRTLGTLCRPFVGLSRRYL